MSTTPENNANAVIPLARADLEAVIQKTPFALLLGAKLEEYGDGVANLSVALRPDLTMHMGFAHGAVVGFLADSACAWAAASTVGNVVTSEYKLNLIAPGIGEQLRAEGRVLKAAGRNLVCMANVYAVNQGKSTLGRVNNQWAMSILDL
ncbi:PaaI family thioesterase [Verminephrobacter eiseniae]|uniref:PaaI family thioesterase n=2 Tax=Verminephrobacter eiseniae TaxID=364317 RepID=UPI002237865C|nr:PaaI family thioesterase [Verminephrobacter eiseniae]MCW5231625.1 PaaI family thioesterase [Verminephrobacter eiseniae]MCW5233394.1 PaaI family thioesterase [Verminephrobacter eiseniae]MCW5293356.1 PaaI family thioesterase [Verminephrobacter eiseniae]MCW5295053.1 PaaI family thioesterase [Verminephrobacter eiseniae]